MLVVHEILERDMPEHVDIVVDEYEIDALADDPFVGVDPLHVYSRP